MFRIGNDIKLRSLKMLISSSAKCLLIGRVKFLIYLRLTANPTLGTKS
ncbi:unnamed protein product [Larinioides sclopetarius]|uniref:Uncharacterized protein n=1 Tax=Larinioides sclopetarius TaxID=280406 RepID=A0AAV1YVH6_9ARAC